MRPKTKFVDGDPNGMHEMMELFRLHSPYYWTWRYTYTPPSIILWTGYPGSPTIIRCLAPGAWEFST